LEGYQDRAREFSRFEEHFEVGFWSFFFDFVNFECCISRSAIRTKFEAHLRRAQEILDKVQSNISSVNGAIDQEKRLKLVEKGRREDELQSGIRAFRHFEELCKRQGENLRAEVHLKVAADFTEEIQRLESIIDKFDHNFVDDAQKIVEYKEALGQFVDELVTRELEERCTGGLMQRIWKLENDMFNHVNSILPGPYPQRLEAVWKYRNPVQFRITVNCPALVEDFHEDLEFRFSFGITALMRRLIAFRAGQPITAIGEPLAMRSNGPSTSTSESKELSVRDNTDQAVMVNAFVLSTASYVANGGVGLVIVCGLVYRTVGWKVIATGAGIYGGLYLIERLRWNSHAKEQHLKEQFRSHLAVRMRQVAASHTANCESQAISELEAAEKGLKVAVTGFHMEMKTNTGLLKGSIDRLEEIVKKLKSISFDVGSLKSKLEEFQANFLKADSPTKQ